MEEKKSSSAALHELPPIKKLFEDSWELFKKSVFSIFLIDIISVVAYVGLTFILLIFVIFLFYVGSSSSFLAVLVTAIFTILFILGFFLIAFTTHIAIILTVNRAGKMPPEQALKKGMYLAVPLFLAYMLSVFLELGGFFLFIIPGILFSFFFLFVSYEVILENRHWIRALRRSFAIVETHFGEILVRIVIIIGISLAISMVLPGMSGRMGIILFPISIFINILMKWFIIAYSIVLYKQAKAATDERHEKGIFWIVLVSALGWVIGIILLSTVIAVISDMVASGEWQKYWRSDRRMMHHRQWENNSSYFGQDLSPTPQNDGF